MSARVSYWDGVESAYAAAQAWVDLGLRKDDSLFTPGKSIWTRELLGELHRRFLDRPDDSRRPFLDKLEDQLSGSPAGSAPTDGGSPVRSLPAPAPQ